VLRPEATVEVSVCPRLSEVVMRIAGATIVAYPSVVLRANVRNVRLALLVHFHVVLVQSPGILSSNRRQSVRRGGCPRGSWTTRGNVSTANSGLTAPAVCPPMLPKSSHANENR
jgi:hypothetical protein